MSPSLETREKIRNSLKGYKHSEETKRKMSLGQKGKKRPPRSEEHIRKLSLANKGRKRSPEAMQKWRLKMKGFRHSQETKDKLRLAGKKQKHFSGKKCPAWRGGVTPEHIRMRTSIKYGLWRKAVFARDNWICQKTGLGSNDLVAHHILNFSNNKKLRFVVENGITLSRKAHDEFHSKYGKRNNTRVQLEEFLNENLIG